MGKINQMKVSIAVLIMIVITGFIMAWVSEGVSYCTEKACSCENSIGKIDCNTCSVYKPVFFSIVLNYGKACTAKEVIECSSSESRIEVDKSKCTGIWNSAFQRAKFEGMVIFEEEE